MKFITWIRIKQTRLVHIWHWFGNMVGVVASWAWAWGRGVGGKVFVLTTTRGQRLKLRRTAPHWSDLVKIAKKNSTVLLRIQWNLLFKNGILFPKLFWPMVGVVASWAWAWGRGVGGKVFVLTTTRGQRLKLRRTAPHWSDLVKIVKKISTILLGIEWNLLFKIGILFPKLFWPMIGVVASWAWAWGRGIGGNVFVLMTTRGQWLKLRRTAPH